MVYFLADGNYVHVGFVRADRELENAIDLLQRGNYRELELLGVLTRAGVGLAALLHKTLEGWTHRGHWFELTRVNKDFVRWVQHHPNAGVAEIRKAVYAMRAQSKQQRTGAVRPASTVMHGGREPLCPGCSAPICDGENWNVVTEDERQWHSMCAPRDKIVVGEVVEDGEYVRDLVYADFVVDGRYRGPTSSVEWTEAEANAWKGA